jgi:chaperonin cofactor prefoldin
VHRRLSGRNIHHARPHLQAAISHIEDAVEELENVDPEKNISDTLRTGDIIIGKLL